MKKALDVLIVLLLAVIIVSLGYIIYCRLTFVPSASFKGKLNIPITKSSESSKNLNSEEKEQEEIPAEVLSQVESLSSVVTSYFVKVKNGPLVYPSLVFKAVPKEDGLEVYLLTFYPMEWPFVKVSLSGESLGAPQKVYQCPGGLLLLTYVVKGIFPVEVEKGEIGQYGVLVTWTGSNFYVKPFDKSKGCNDNGFVFNLAGDFSGVCFGGSFYGAKDLYSSVPNSCKIIFQEEGKNGDLQSENR